MKKLSAGVNPVLMTPLKEGGGINAKAYGSMVPKLLGAGVHGLVVLGSMGELPYLSDRERRAAVETVAELAAGKVPVIAGAAAFGTQEAVRRGKDAVKAGADALLVPLPVYFSPDFKDIEEHFRRIAGETGVPILYYHFPAVTHLDLAGEKIARLFDIENIVGLKESIMDLPTIRKHLKVFPEGILVFSGSTFLMRQVMGLGGRGAICPIPDILPEAAVALYKACLRKDRRAALDAEKRIFDLAPLFVDLPLAGKALRQAILAAASAGAPLKGGPPPHALVKEALRLQGHPISSLVKCPLPQLTTAQADRVRNTMKAAGLI